MEETFDITYQLAILKVAKMGKSKFRVQFSNEVPPMVISRSDEANGKISWRMEPPGNDELAAGIGKLIDEAGKS